MSIRTSFSEGESNHPMEEKGNKTNKAMKTNTSNTLSHPSQIETKNNNNKTELKAITIMTASQYQHLSFPLNNEMNTITMGMCGCQNWKWTNFVLGFNVRSFQDEKFGNIQMSIRTSEVKGSRTILWRRKETKQTKQHQSKIHIKHLVTSISNRNKEQQQQQLKAITTKRNKNIDRLSISTPLLSTQQRNEHNHDGNVWLPKLEMNELCLGFNVRPFKMRNSATFKCPFENKLGEGESKPFYGGERKQNKESNISQKYTSNTLSHPSQIETKNNNKKQLKANNKTEYKMLSSISTPLLLHSTTTQSRWKCCGCQHETLTLEQCSILTLPFKLSNLKSNIGQCQNSWQGDEQQQNGTKILTPLNINTSPFHSTTKWTQSRWKCVAAKTGNQRTLSWASMFAPFKMRNSATFKCPFDKLREGESNHPMEEKGNKTKKATSVKNTHQTPCHIHLKSKQRTTTTKQLKAITTKRNKNIERLSISTPLLSTQQRNEHNHDGNVWLPKLEMNELCLGLQCSLLSRWEIWQHSNVHSNKLCEGESNHAMEEKGNKTNKATSVKRIHIKHLVTSISNRNKEQQQQNSSRRSQQNDASQYQHLSFPLNNEMNTITMEMCGCQKLEMNELCFGLQCSLLSKWEIRQHFKCPFDKLREGESHHSYGGERKQNKESNIIKIQTSNTLSHPSQMKQRPVTTTKQLKAITTNGTKILSASEYQHLSFPLNNEMNTITMGCVAAKTFC